MIESNFYIFLMLLSGTLFTTGSLGRFLVVWDFAPEDNQELEAYAAFSFLMGSCIFLITAFMWLENLYTANPVFSK